MNRNDRAIVGLVALAHATVHTYELSIPILIPIWLDAFPVTQSTLGVVVATGYALFGLGALPGGVLSDSVGSQRLITGCLVAMAVAFGALASLSVVFLPAAGAGLLPLLVAGVCLGFALFVVQPLYQTTVAEYTPAGTRGLSYGYTYLGVFGVGAIGAAVAGAILEFGSPPVLFAVLSGFALAAAATAAWLSLR